MVLGFRVILKDKNKTLVKIDREIYSSSTINLFLLAIYFTIYGISLSLLLVILLADDFTLSSIRSLSLYNETLICQILISMVYEEKYYILI